MAGTYFESCNCDVTCPCAVSGFKVPGDYERCIVLLAFHVDSGEIDGIDVSGLSYAVLADAPGAMAKGNWRVGMLMDAAASPEQAEALAAVASGQRGGAPAAFKPLRRRPTCPVTAPPPERPNPILVSMAGASASQVSTKHAGSPQLFRCERSRCDGVLHRSASCERSAGATLTSRARIRVERAMDGTGSTIPPKSRAGLRTVPTLTAELCEVLAEHRDSSRALRDDYVFAGSSPTSPFSPGAIYRRVRTAWRQAEIDPINLHEARHAFASTAIAAGLNAKIIATYMGHSSIQATYDLYGKLMPGNEAEASALFEKYLGR